MMVTVIVLLSVLVLLHAVTVALLLRPVFALARLLEAGADTAESAARVAGRFAGE